MASLSTILRTKTSGLTLVESNIDTGEIYLYHPGMQDNDRSSFTWASPGTGTAVVEIWGASGSGSGIRCCGAGLPGNPGAYSKKTFAVNGSSCITGVMGQSCGNASTYCYRGRSTSTCICWVGSAANGCMCAQGGDGGTSCCQSGGSIYCCLVADGHTGTVLATGCGTVCNTKNGAAEAIGGDENVNGGISCTTFYTCTSCCWCSHVYHTATSPRIFSEEGAIITYQADADNPETSGPQMGPYFSLVSALNATSRSPQIGRPWAGSCWQSRMCGCYVMSGCLTLLPYGVPGTAPHPCDSARDFGSRGGHGLVKIRFIGS